MFFSSFISGLIYGWIAPILFFGLYAVNAVRSSGKEARFLEIKYIAAFFLCSGALSTPFAVRHVLSFFNTDDSINELWLIVPGIVYSFSHFAIAFIILKSANWKDGNLSPVTDAIGVSAAFCFLQAIIETYVLIAGATAGPLPFGPNSPSDSVIIIIVYTLAAVGYTLVGLKISRIPVPTNGIQ